MTPLNGSNPHRHLSASERKILGLQAQLEVYQAMRGEYYALMNYIIAHHSTEVAGEDPYFFVEGAKLQALEPFRIVRTEICEVNGVKGMKFTLCEPEKEKSLIIHS